MSKLKVFIPILALIMATSAFAQQPPGQVQEQRRFGPKRQAAIIIFAGLGGAVLGLSTLSFYGRPQDKLSNIAIGAAVGIIVGTTYVTYKAATQPSEFYGEQYRRSMLDNPHQLGNESQGMVAGYRWEF